MSRKGDALTLLAIDLRAVGIPDPVLEYAFAQHLGRRWRFDLAWPGERLAVEIDGGTWTGGRHTTGRGHESDSRKRNAAVLEGWRVLTFSTEMARSGEAVQVIEEAWKRG